MAALRAEFAPGMAAIPAADWDALFGDDCFACHAWMEAMESSGCACGARGWRAHHALQYDGGRLVAAMPLYVKHDSFGEFVFDEIWAMAYARLGVRYYPKLVTAVPYTPVVGARLGVLPGADPAALGAAVRDEARRLGASGWHILFADHRSREALAGLGLAQRDAVQFQWRNQGYASFEDWLAALRASRRKQVRRERRAMAADGIAVRWRGGAELDAGDWELFMQCYEDTNLRHSGDAGYLNGDFFRLLAERQGHQVQMAQARRGGRTIACALFMRAKDSLHGRYWGALAQVRYLHFELCLYSGIEYCIRHGLAHFDPGVQGVHKLLRGFEPEPSRSLHWLAEPRLHHAIGRFLEQERGGVAEQSLRLDAALSPYRRAAP